MSPFTKYIAASLGLSALLLSNFVGLIHVGRHLTPVAETPAAAESSSCCSCHSHACSSIPVDETEDDDSEKQPHDEDCCVVCQCFLSAGVGSELACSTGLPPEVFEEQLFLADFQDLHRGPRNGPSVRGPPAS